MNAHLPRWIALRLMGLTLLTAIVSFWTQMDGLIGPEGISPATDLLRQTAQWAGEKNASAFANRPTLGWLFGGDTTGLTAICGLGLAAAIALILNIAPRLALFVGWLAYLSLFHVSGPFLGYQWDILLIEALLVMIPYAPTGFRPRLATESQPSALAIWLVRLLVFKVIFSSGVVKLSSGDPTWRDLSAMDYHYWTQPLPHALAWHAHAAHWTHQISVVLTFLIELGAPLLILFDIRRWRLLAFAGLVALAGVLLADGSLTGWSALGLLGLLAVLDQRVLARIWPGRFVVERTDRTLAFVLIVGLMGAISLTGSYGFFQLLTVALCFSLLDDRALRRMPVLKPPRISVIADPRTAALAIAFAAVLLPVNAVQVTALVGRSAQREAARAVDAEAASLGQNLIDDARRLRGAMLDYTGPFASANGYGLFATMTRQRIEIIIEGSADGRTGWTPYRFEYKPEALDAVARYAGLHMPRLDWQMWFAALRPRCARGWYPGFVKALLRGSPAVLGLLADPPFAQAPPRAIRAMRMQYRFTDRETRDQSGAIWTATPAGEYCPPLTIKKLEALAR